MRSRNDLPRDKEEVCWTEKESFVKEEEEEEAVTVKKEVESETVRVKEEKYVSERCILKVEKEDFTVKEEEHKENHVVFGLKEELKKEEDVYGVEERTDNLINTDEDNIDVAKSDLSEPMPQQHRDADPQWELPALTDHTYVSKEPISKPTCHKKPIKPTCHKKPIKPTCHKKPIKPICHKHTHSSGTELITNTFLKNDSSSVFHTGLSLNVFFEHVAFLQKFYTASFKMPVTDQVLMTLMKLKLNLLQGELAGRFAVSQGIVSRILSYWIDTMEEHMRIYIPWLPRETIQNTMPQCFKEKFPNTTCIIDCSETMLQKPHVGSRWESYSHYYSSGTLKYLVAMAPCGVIMFISPAYGGECSDKFITQYSGFLEYLRPGDEVMADRSSTIRDLLYERKVNLAIPAFTQKGGQLSEEDVTSTKRLADVQVHVERVIQRLKVFKIVSQTVPHLANKMDKVLRICAALVNMQGESEQ